jgi:citronellol/citronellal dehydrogenase
VNNASAIRLTGTLATPVKRYDLMHGVNGRGTFVCAQACLPHLLESANPHILTLSPPLVQTAKWFSDFPAYTIAKYTMSLFTLALAGEFKNRGVAVNSLWPRIAIATAAVRNEIGMVDIAPRLTPGPERPPSSAVTALPRGQIVCCVCIGWVSRLADEQRNA